jgi:uncharacterized protein (DUF433 family)
MAETIPLTSQSPVISGRYVTIDPMVLQGEPIILGTEVAVRDIVVLWKSGERPETIPQRLFNLVTVAQVFDGLSFYADYPDQIDRWIEQYADHPSPLSRLNPLWDGFVQNMVDYRQSIDREVQDEVG